MRVAQLLPGVARRPAGDVVSIASDAAARAAMGQSGRERVSAAQIAEVLDREPPTPEQVAVIEASASSCLVVAGAGSGKTETMAGRVVWLVANGIVRPEQVLGLTFTRKAAAELAGRIRRRLAQLARHGLLDAEVAMAGEPTVSTYDAYAARIVAEHALRLGREPGQRLITPTAAWQYARRAVDTYDGDMDAVAVQPSTVTTDVLELAEGLTQHRVTDDELRAFCDRLAVLVAALPKAVTKSRPRKNAKALHTDLEKIVAALNARCQLLPVVAAYRENKRRGEALDFADQMALAAELAERFAEVAVTERQTYRAVLLDEYQDTSHAQLAFLRALFGSPDRDGVAAAAPLITAVGDPSQAIYGWRGASQGTLAAFPHHFPAADQPAPVLTLGTSFRNAEGVLAVANEIAAPLRGVAKGGDAKGGDAAVATPLLAARKDAPAGVVVCGCYETVDDEADAVAEQVRQAWRAGLASAALGGPTRSIAVLVRTWSQLPRIEAALRGRGVPLQILGVGGLLLEPEVVDVVAVLRVLVDASRGDALMRLLTGARWRIGPRDLAALGRWARHLAVPRDELPDVAAVELDPDEVDDRSIVDALDDLPPRGWLSEAGYERLSALSRELRTLRGRLVQPLPDIVGDVIRTTGIDVEVLARDGNTRAAATRANLDALVDVAAEFASGGEAANLPAFLDYLDAAASQERGLDRPDDDVSQDDVPETGVHAQVRDDRVQLLTVHRAKGLEWDVVCVPGLVENVFPNMRVTDAKGWLTQRGALPWPLRGDRHALPVAGFDAVSDQTEALAAVDAFKSEVAAHLLDEERRLAYVAVTRARDLLVCTGYRWDDTKKPRIPSVFLESVRAICEAGAGVVDEWAPEPVDAAPNPRHAAGPVRAPWPYDPLGERRAAVEEAAAAVRERLAAPPAEAPHAPEVAAAMAEWDRDVEVLLAERAARESRAGIDVALPPHLSVSQLVTLQRDPGELARQLRRPLPAAPAPLARRGTTLHAWLEQRFGSPRLLDIDELPGSADADAAPDADLAALQQAFLASPWAARDPVDVEVGFELVVGDPGVVIRGRMDAVYRDADGGFTVVDWKTGRRPSGADAEAAAVQLAAYRLAWAELTGVELARVRAAFCYLRPRPGTDQPAETVSPSDLLDRDGVEELLRSAPSVRQR